MKRMSKWHGNLKSETFFIQQIVKRARISLLSFTGYVCLGVNMVFRNCMHGGLAATFDALSV